MAPADPSPGRRAPQNPYADRSLQRPGKLGSPVQVRTQIKILPAPRPRDAVAPRQNPGSVRFAAPGLKSLLIRSDPPVACVGLMRRHRLPLPPPALCMKSELRKKGLNNRTTILLVANAD